MLTNDKQHIQPFARKMFLLQKYKFVIHRFSLETKHLIKFGHALNMLIIKK